MQSAYQMLSEGSHARAKHACSQSTQSIIKHVRACRIPFVCASYAHTAYDVHTVCIQRHTANTCTHKWMLHACCMPSICLLKACCHGKRMPRQNQTRMQHPLKSACLLYVCGRHPNTKSIQMQIKGCTIHEMHPSREKTKI